MARTAEERRAYQREYMREYLIKNPDYLKLRYAKLKKDPELVARRAEAQKQYHAKNPTHSHKYTVGRYGITPEQYNAMLLAQNSCCAICGRHQSQFKRRLAIDHDHVTQELRGLLCHGCNWSLGKYEASKAKFEPYLNKK